MGSVSASPSMTASSKARSSASGPLRGSISVASARFSSSSTEAVADSGSSEDDCSSTVSGLALSDSAVPIAASSSGSWCQLCLHAAQRTCRPSGGIAPSLTTYCVPQLGQVRIIASKALFRDGAGTVNRNDWGFARRRLCGSVYHRAGRDVAAVAEFDSVGLRYGTGAEVLRDLDFRLRTGSFYFLTGPSGAGKTSLLKLLYLAQRPTRGRVRLFGEELSESPREALPPFRRRIGVVFQDFRLVRHLSAFDNVALPLRVAGASEQEIEGPVREMLAWVGLADRASARPPTLSGGEQQRVAIARAVIHRPQLP